MKKLILFIFPLFTLLFVGCGGANLDYNGIKLNRDQTTFIDNLQPMTVAQVDKNSLITQAILPEAGNNLVYSIDLTQKQNSVIGVVVYEDNDLNFTQILIKEKDYFFNKEDNNLLINFNIPYLYLLKGTLKLKAKIIYMDDNHKIKSFERSFIFNYQPMIQADDGDHLSYKYMKFTDKNLDNLNDINKKHLKEEIKRIDKTKLSNDYKKLLENVMDKI